MDRCRLLAIPVRAAVGKGIPMGIPMGMGMGTMMNPHGVCGDSVGILYGYEIKRKHVKYATNVIIDV